MTATNKNKMMTMANDILTNDGHDFALQLSSVLFQKTLEIKPKTKWLVSEDALIETFFYLSSKEELCEALECDMASLHDRAKVLGVLSSEFDTLNAYDMELALTLFSEGLSQEEIIDLFGISSLSIPANSLTSAQKASIYSRIESSNFNNNPQQMDLF